MGMLHTMTNAIKFETDPASGSTIDSNGCHYESEAKAMYFYALGLCGCGRPVDVHQMLIDVLKCIDTGKRLDAVAELVKQKPDVVAEFIGHFLEDKGMTEHGSSVYSSWLSERGKQFIDIGPIDG